MSTITDVMIKLLADEKILLCCKESYFASLHGPAGTIQWDDASIADAEVALPKHKETTLEFTITGNCLNIIAGERKKVIPFSCSDPNDFVFRVKSTVRDFTILP